MAQNHIIILKNKETKEVYRTFKNKKQNPDKLTQIKFSKKLNKRAPFVEVKK
ncbi:MAG: ribosomal protein L33 [Candidatus Paceibacteria bacterium]|jgi:ribosomal protein L33